MQMSVYLNKLGFSSNQKANGVADSEFTRKYLFYKCQSLA